jgi:uncharacterized damage-inducible protein DinB
MNRAPLVGQLETARRYFERTTSCFVEADADFRPTPETMSVAEQIAHTAQTVGWFLDGALEPTGFSLDFEAHEQEIRTVQSLAEARGRLATAFDRAVQVVPAQDDGFWEQALPEGPVLGGEPRHVIVGGISEHTAHHRGALAVYARLCGHVPPMPYGMD